MQEKILLHARERFFQDGFSRVSIDDVSRDLGISKKTFYQAFVSKDQLVELIVERMKRDVAKFVEGVLKSDEAFVEKLNRLMAFLGATAARIGSPFGQDLYKYRREIWSGIEELRRTKVNDIFSRLLQEGVEKGYLRDDVNVKVFTMAFLGAVENTIQPQKLAQESFSGSEALTTIMHIFFSGIMTDKARKQFLKDHVSKDTLKDSI